MSTYDPDDWLVSATRVLHEYVETTLGTMLPNDEVTVEMSFPNTRDWPKELPLDKPLIHFEQDDLGDPILGFGVPGVEVIDDVTDPDNPTSSFHEAAEHIINYDVGVWTSAQSGGTTKRMIVVQALKNMLATAGGKLALNEATGGLQVVSFNGGRNELDRVNDVPVWRALDMTLVVRCFSRHIPEVPDVVPTSVIQEPHLTIQDGSTVDPLVTP